MTEDTKVQYRSVSQLKQYERCPMSYKLSRVDKVWQRPAAWLPQGTAVHSVAEVKHQRELAGDPMSLEAAQRLFAEEYANEISKYTGVTPNFEFWFASGPYRGVQDVERRFGLGLAQVERLYTWYDRHPEESIWITPDGKPAIELPFNFDLDGVPVRGYIDAVVNIGTGLLVRDYKTGNTPGDDFQLAVYAVAIEDLWGVQIVRGDYWMGKSGKPTHPYDLSDWPRAKVAEKFHELEANLAAGRFDPDPAESKCTMCDVAISCPLFQSL